MPRATVRPAVLLVACLACSGAGRAQEPAVTAKLADERAPEFRAGDVLAEAILTGPHYELEDRVTLQGNRLQFRMTTQWGVLPIDGKNMLEVRIREMYAVDRARELAANPQLLTGVLDTLHQTPEGVRILLTEPAQVLRRAPQGVKGLLSSQINPADRRAGSSIRRRLAVDIGCDPETTNPLLTGLLDRMALEKGIGQVAGKVGLSAALPGLGLIPLTASFKEIVAAKLPSEINRELDAELAGLEVEQAVRERFFANPSLTTTRRLLFMHHFRRLQRVGNVSYLVHAAGAAPSEGDGLAVIEETQLLAQLHAAEGVERIVAISPPLVELTDGSRALVWSADHLAHTGTFVGVLAGCTAAVPPKPTRLVVSGRLSERAAAACRRLGIEVRERAQEHSVPPAGHP